MPKTKVIKNQWKRGQVMRVRLHPLTLLNVSDHLTRTIVGKDSPDLQEIQSITKGVLLGTVTFNRDSNACQIEVYNSFPLKVSMQTIHDNGKKPEFNEQLLSKRQRHYSEVFKELYPVGMYSIHPYADTPDNDIFPTMDDNYMANALLRHESFSALGNEMESTEGKEPPPFIHLVLDPTRGRHLNSVIYPVGVYIESAVGGAKELREETLFTRVPFTIESGEAEKIAVEHAARMAVETSKNGKKESDYETYLLSVQASLDLLAERLKIVRRKIDSLSGDKTDRTLNFERCIRCFALVAVNGSGVCSVCGTRKERYSCDVSMSPSTDEQGQTDHRSLKFYREVAEICNALRASQPPQLRDQFAKDTQSSLSTLEVNSWTNVFLNSTHIPDVPRDLNDHITRISRDPRSPPSWQRMDV
eukprot:GHVN01031434.1.p1 GENE.GHVN01031434.1~~GHVN01031434.1.p1  ORF type:complete len:467 (-),score=39.54 GHVN01031434.1:1614-2861(-)